MERICIVLSESDLAAHEDLPARLQASGYRLVTVQQALEAIPPATPRTLADLEREAILHALRHHRGNKAAVARHLGVCEKTIYNKLKRYGVDADDFRSVGNGP